MQANWPNILVISWLIVCSFLVPWYGPRILPTMKEILRSVLYRKRDSSSCPGGYTDAWLEAVKADIRALPEPGADTRG